MCDFQPIFLFCKWFSGQVLSQSELELFFRLIIYTCYVFFSLILFLLHRIIKCLL